MDFQNEAWIKATILYHLRRKRVIGAKHTHYDTLKFGFPSHLGKDIKKIADELIKQGFIVVKSTSYGLQVSLNKDKLREIEDFIKKVLGYDFQ
ncbi:hypothetical protein HYW76_00940 [Candidatus Pacearchaeota archaeon]|nr:hypothetical protein [Candidatus Pacearchaeota archaeon]